MSEQRLSIRRTVILLSLVIFDLFLLGDGASACYHMLQRVSRFNISMLICNGLLLPDPWIRSYVAPCWRILFRCELVDIDIGQVHVPDFYLDDAKGAHRSVFHS